MTSPSVRKTCSTPWHPYLPPGAVETPGVGHRMTGTTIQRSRAKYSHKSTTDNSTSHNEPLGVSHDPPRYIGRGRAAVWTYVHSSFVLISFM